MSLRTADDTLASISTDSHGVVGSPTATHSPHLFQSHPPQPTIPASSSNSPNVAIPSRPSLSSKSSSSPPRSSTEADLAGRPSPSVTATARWRNSLPPVAQRSEPPQTESIVVVEPSFDESVLRALCELDVRLLLSNPLGMTYLIYFSRQFSAVYLYCSTGSNRAWCPAG
jgi:hypothetical protein